jgi:hypothetical protein
LAGGLNLYGYANGDPINFSDPFGLCSAQAGPDSITIEVTVRCDDGKTTETQSVTAKRVNAADLEALAAIVGEIAGGSPAFSVDQVQAAYRGVIGTGDVYQYDVRAAGGIVTAGGVTSNTGVVGFRSDVWGRIRGGRTDLSGRTCVPVGHEGVHLVQVQRGNFDGNPFREAGARAVGFGCR